MYFYTFFQNGSCEIFNPLHYEMLDPEFLESMIWKKLLYDTKKKWEYNYLILTAYTEWPKILEDPLFESELVK